MAVETLSALPVSIVAGDTLRVTLDDSDYPSSGWGLRVLFDGPSRETFAAEEDSGDAFSLVVEGVDTARLKPGSYNLVFIYTETSSGDRQSIQAGKIEVAADPDTAPTKTVARRTLEEMEAALLKLSSGSNASVSFNGQSFTKRNLAELQNAIAVQRSIVSAETATAALPSDRKRYTGIGVRFA